MEKEGIKRNIEIKIRLSEAENEKLDKLAEKIKMSKARMIRNIVLGEIDNINILYNIGIIPIVKSYLEFRDRNFSEKIKQDYLYTTFY